MLSKTSFFNKTIYKKNLTRFAAFPILYSVVLLLSIPGQCIVERLQMLNYPTVYGSVNPDQYDFYRVIMGGNLPILVALYMILVTLAVFSYLYQQRSCHMMHAFPVDRRTLFLTGLASILTMAFIPQFVTALITTIAAFLLGADSIVWIIWYWLFCMFCYDLIFMGMAVFTAMISGQMVTNFVFYWIFQFMFSAGEIVIRLLLSFLCFGMYNSEIAPHKLNFLSPVTYLDGQTDLYINEATYRIYHADPKGILALLLYTAAGLLFTFAAYRLYRKKQLETTGDFITVSYMKPFFTFGMTFFVSMLLTVGAGYWITDIVNTDTSKVFISVLLCCLLLSIIIYFITQMFIERSHRVFTKKHALSCSIYSGIILVFLLMVHMDLFGIESYVPDSKEILRADARFMGETYTFTDATEIETMARLHGAILVEKESLSHASHVSEDPYLVLDLRYHLKDGSVVARSYRIVSYNDKSAEYSKMCQELMAFFNEPEIIKHHIIGENYADLSLDAISISLTRKEEQDNYEETTLSRNDGSLDALYEAFLKDIDEGNYTPMILDKTKEVYTDGLVLSFSSPTTIATDETMASVPDSAVSRESVIASGWGDRSWDVYLELTPECSHTIRALADLNLIEDAGDLTISNDHLLTDN